MKTFTFSDADEELLIKIPEVLNASFGMYVWPSAPFLAEHVWQSRALIKGKHVLELGAGTALPGLVAAKVGAKLTLSDGAHLADCLNNCMASLKANDIDNAKVAAVSWGQFGPDMLTIGPVDIILGSDCFYDSKDFENILATVAYLLEKNPLAQFWTSYQERSPDRCIAHLLRKWKLKAELVQMRRLEIDSAEGSVLQNGSLPSHTIIIYKIQRDSI